MGNPIKLINFASLCKYSLDENTVHFGIGVKGDLTMQQVFDFICLTLIINM